MGSLVLVSVRGRASIGVVLREVEPPEFDTRQIDGIASPVTIPSTQLELACWMSMHYRVPGFECLKLAFPPGSRRERVEERRISLRGLLPTIS